MRHKPRYRIWMGMAFVAITGLGMGVHHEWERARAREAERAKARIMSLLSHYDPIPDAVLVEFLRSQSPDDPSPPPTPSPDASQSNPD
jgi:hypothetical protein